MPRGKKRGFAGGSLQVAARVRAAVAADCQPTVSKLAHLLLQKRAWGHLSSSVVQQTALAAVEDGASCERMVEISKIGNSGVCPGNCDRDLNISPLRSAMVSVKFTFIDAFRRKAEGDQSLLLPHLLWSALYEFNPKPFEDHFSSSLAIVEKLLYELFAYQNLLMTCWDCAKKQIWIGGREQIQQFWSSTDGHPALAGHPRQGIQDWSNCGLSTNGSCSCLKTPA